MPASRLEALQRIEAPEELDLTALVAEEAAAFDASVAGQSVRVVGDARLLRRLVRNLLENPRRYAPGSLIDVTVSPAGERQALVVVEDSGPGVPAGERERIFEPVTLPRDPTAIPCGSGLGLALVRQIARHHGGDARCLPRQGGGSRFEVTLAVGDLSAPIARTELTASS